jgi:NADH-quinone oxidoreductase subunit I
MKRYFSDLFVGGKSLVDGLVVTFKALCQPIVTVQYPREEIDITPISGDILILFWTRKKIPSGAFPAACANGRAPPGALRSRAKKKRGKRKKH